MTGYSVACCRWQDIGDYLSKKSAPAQPGVPKVKGLYMFGGVGTGKTMLMDLLVNSAPPQFKVMLLPPRGPMLICSSQHLNVSGP